MVECDKFEERLARIDQILETRRRTSADFKLLAANSVKVVIRATAHTQARVKRGKMAGAGVMPDLT